MLRGSVKHARLDFVRTRRRLSGEELSDPAKVPEVVFLAPEKVLAHLGTPREGLSETQASERLAQDGPNDLPEPRRRPTEAPNLVFAGTTITSGHGLAVVYATGPRSEFGRIARFTTAVEHGPSTFELQVKQMVRMITSLAVAMGAVVFLFTAEEIRKRFLRRGR